MFTDGFFRVSLFKKCYNFVDTALLWSSKFPVFCHESVIFVAHFDQRQFVFSIYQSTSNR